MQPWRLGNDDTHHRRFRWAGGHYLQKNGFGERVVAHDYGTRYIVLDVINHSSPDGYYGALLRDDSTNTLFVVDRGTDPKNWQDMATDIVMAGTNQNAQWQDADALAQFVSQYATTNGSVIYTVGHSGWHARRCRRRSREIRGRGMILGIDVISPPRWDAHRDREFM